MMVRAGLVDQRNALLGRWIFHLIMGHKISAPTIRGLGSTAVASCGVASRSLRNVRSDMDVRALAGVIIDYNVATEPWGNA
jgi:hypothetical protein